MEVKFDIQGLKELERELLALEAKASWKVLRAAGRKSMKPVQEEMAENAGFDTRSDSKHMKDDIKIKVRKAGKRSKNTAMSVTVGPHKAHAQKAIAQEFGTATQSAVPFIRPALCDNAQLIIDTFKELLKKGIAKAKQ